MHLICWVEGNPKGGRRFSWGKYTHGEAIVQLQVLNTRLDVSKPDISVFPPLK